VDVSETHWDDALLTVRPDDVYEVAIEHLHEGEQVVAHTIHPHYPHVHEVDGEVVPVKNSLHPRELNLD